MPVRLVLESFEMSLELGPAMKTMRSEAYDAGN